MDGVDVAMMALSWLHSESPIFLLSGIKRAEAGFKKWQH